MVYGLGLFIVPFRFRAPKSVSFVLRLTLYSLQRGWQSVFCGALMDGSGDVWGVRYRKLDSMQWEKYKSQIETQTLSPLKAAAKYTSSWGHYREPTLEGLAQTLQLRPAKLKASIEAYNSAITNDSPDPVSSITGLLSPLLLSMLSALVSQQIQSYWLQH